MNDLTSQPRNNVTIELSRLTPGPRLSKALARLPDLSTLSSAQLAEVLNARARQLAHEQAQLLVAARQLTRTAHIESTAATHRLDPAAEAGHVSRALRCTPRQAQQCLQVAADLIVRLPAVFAALNSGRLDMRRAQLFAEQLRRVDDVTARAITAKLIDRASEWSQTALRRSLRYHVLRVDPSQARSAGQRGTAERAFSIHQCPDGTATIVGKSVPLAAALRVDENLDRLAAQAKRKGDPRTLRQVRADVAVTLLCGQPWDARTRVEQSTDKSARPIIIDGEASDLTLAPANVDKRQPRKTIGRWPGNASHPASSRFKGRSGRRGRARRAHPRKRQ